MLRLLIMKHIPVLKNEVLEAFSYLKDVKNSFFVDGTLGLAGHSLAIAEQFKIQKIKFKIMGIDKDKTALRLAKENIENTGFINNFLFVHDDFKNIEEILKNLRHSRPDLESRNTTGKPTSWIPDLKLTVRDDESDNGSLMINGALIDLGVSSMQLDDKKRGFSFSDPEAALDMRMDQTQELSAFDVLNYYPQLKLEKIFKEYGEEKFYKNIAKNICKDRKIKPIEKVGELLDILEISIPTKIRKTSKKHFATGTFRALRLEVNQELTKLDTTLMNFINALKKGSRLAVISFHSTEDRIVKETFRKAENPCVCPPLAPVCTCENVSAVKIITKKPIIPSDQEIAENPRSRSAKLRIIEKL
ncbi:MAG: 16S rRNA (cytosine(1402)-N(4))-methyltransferase RsmH [Patescibacteria group bacterium]